MIEPVVVHERRTPGKRRSASVPARRPGLLPARALRYDATFMAGDDEQVRALAQRLESELNCVHGHVQRLRRQNTVFGYTSLVSGATSSLLAGGVATTGPVVGTWSMTCGIVAVIAACGTIASGLQAQLAVADKLARATACAGKLDALRVALTISRRDLREVAGEYERLVEVNREFLR